jgi:pyruvate formate lyase activating enzyme
MEKVRKLGFLVKLDTNGTRPEILEKVIKEKRIDYVAMDFKAPIDDYQKVVNVKFDWEKIKKSVKVIKEGGIDYEFRTTVLPKLIGKEDIAKMAKYLQGASKWYLQKFKSEVDLVNMDYKDLPSYTDKEMDELVGVAKKYFKNVSWR